MRARLITASLPSRLDARAFPDATPLGAFFAWNEARYFKDRRYVIACDIHRLLCRFKGEIAVCLVQLAGQPIIRRRAGSGIGVSKSRLRAALGGAPAACQASPAVASEQPLVDSLLSSIGSSEIDRHAAVF